MKLCSLNGNMHARICSCAHKHAYMHAHESTRTRAHITCTRAHRHTCATRKQPSSEALPEGRSRLGAKSFPNDTSGASADWERSSMYKVIFEATPYKLRSFGSKLLGSCLCVGGFRPLNKYPD